MRKSILLVLLITCLGASLSVIAQQEKRDVFLANSREWTDVYSVVQYAFLQKAIPGFLVSEKHSRLILNDYDKNEVRLRVFSSSESPWVIGMKGIAEAEGFETTDNEYDNINLEIAPLVNVTKYIILDDAYGYNAISVGPYAIADRYYVLFVNADNIADVVDFLNSRQVDNIIVYGHVDREVRDALQPFNPEIINNNGDRYANNIEIVKRYQKIRDNKQVILNNGEFIEAQIMSGTEPVIFIGQGSIPDVVREYITSTDIQIGVLIGNELVRTATDIRRQLGISVFVKYARSSRNSGSGISEVEGLDRFLLPSYDLNLQIEKIRYNTVSNQLEVVLRNNAEIATYFRGTYTVNANGATQTVGDTEPLFVDSKRSRTVVYEMDPIANPTSLSANVFVIYGESNNALERILEGEIPVEVINVLDSSEITIEKVEFLLDKQQFVVYLKNIGGVTSYVETEAVGIKVLDEVHNYGSTEIVAIEPGKTGKSVIPTNLVEEDLAKNPKVRIRAYYGENEGLLSKVLEGLFEYKIRRFDLLTYLPTAAIILLILLILASIGRKKCPQCKKKNARRAKYCKKCGHQLK